MLVDVDGFKPLLFSLSDPTHWCWGRSSVLKALQHHHLLDCMFGIILSLCDTFRSNQMPVMLHEGQIRHLFIFPGFEDLNYPHQILNTRWKCSLKHRVLSAHTYYCVTVLDWCHHVSLLYARFSLLVTVSTDINVFRHKTVLAHSLYKQPVNYFVFTSVKKTTLGIMGKLHTWQ